MLRKIIILIGGAAAAASSPAQNVESQAAMFGARESAESVDLSPDGTKIVFLAPASKATVAFVSGLAGGQPAGAIRSTGDPDRLSWCSFLSNTRLVCRVRALRELGGYLTPFGQLSSVDIDGKNMKELGQRRSFYDTRIRQFDGEILDWLPNDGNAVLMSRDYVPERKEKTRIERRENGLGVDRIDVRTLRATRVESPRPDAAGYMTDGRGNVRLLETRLVTATGQLTPEIQYWYRRPGSPDWQKLATYNSETGAGIYPLGIDGERNALYALKKLDGRYALYRVMLNASPTTELVYSNPKVDVDNIVTIGRDSKPIGVTFAEEVREVIYFDKEYEALSNSLSKALPNQPGIRFAGSSTDDKILLIHTGSDTDPGRYYTYDKAKRALNEIMLVRPELENVALAPTKHVTYPAADGQMVPAYLTLPLGREHKKLPAIVMPHGGPTARDELEFDWMTQFFASQGYAVLRPNYRGSSGYGDAWLAENGFRGWATSIGDVTAGGKWLVSQGLADPSKLAIVGWSYGGYAALQSDVTEPDLFKAIVAIAPVTDLAALKRDAGGFTNARLVANFIGAGPHIKEGSPEQNAARIKAPVLMFHGDRDLNVDVNHARRMDAALKQAGKSSELVIFRGLEHDLASSEARTQLLSSTAQFLARSTAAAAK